MREIMFDYGGVIGTLPRENIVESISNVFRVDEGRCRDVLAVRIREAQTCKLSDVFWRSISSDLGIGKHEELKDLWIAHIESDSRLNEGVVSVIEALREKSYGLCLISNTTGLHQYSPHSGRIDNLFDHRILSCEVGARKPDEKIFLIALNMVGVPPSECVLVDDQEKNFVYPRSVGMNTILFEGNEQLKVALEGLPDI